MNIHDAEIHKKRDHFDSQFSLPFPCSNCGLIFCNSQELNNHVQRHHAFHPVQNEQNDDSEVKSFLQYIIDQNKRILDDMNDMKRTVNQRLDELAVEKDEIISKQYEDFDKKVGDITEQVNVIKNQLEV